MTDGKRFKNQNTKRQAPRSTTSAPLYMTHVLVRNPLTNEIMKVSNSKIVRTVGSDLRGAANEVPIMCTDFQLLGVCNAGQGCANVHVLGVASKAWPTIEEGELNTVDGVTLHSADAFILPAYDPTLSYLVQVPSECIARTAGSVSYVEQYNDQGPNGRFRFRICSQFHVEGRCRHEGRCDMIHVVPSAVLGAFENSEVHINFTVREPADSPYMTLPEGGWLRVYDPNIKSQWQDVPTQWVLANQGAQAHLQNTSAHRRLLHCAHFYLKKMCNRGSQCTFIHMLTVDPSAECAVTIPGEVNLPNDEVAAVPRDFSGIGSECGCVENACACSLCDPVVSYGASSSDGGDRDVEKEVDSGNVTPSMTPLATTPKKLKKTPDTIQWYRHDPYSFLSTRIFVSQ